MCFAFLSDIYFQVKNDEDILQTLTAEENVVVWTLKLKSSVIPVYIMVNCYIFLFTFLVIVDSDRAYCRLQVFPNDFAMLDIYFLISQLSSSVILTFLQNHVINV